jgi:hypothetical protein
MLLDIRSIVNEFCHRKNDARLAPTELFSLMRVRALLLRVVDKSDSNSDI